MHLSSPYDHSWPLWKTKRAIRCKSMLHVTCVQCCLYLIWTHNRTNSTIKGTCVWLNRLPSIIAQCYINFHTYFLTIINLYTLWDVTRHNHQHRVFARLSKPWLNYEVRFTKEPTSLLLTVWGVISANILFQILLWRTCMLLLFIKFFANKNTTEIGQTE